MSTANHQWRRSVVIGVRVSQVKPSNRFRLHPTSTISKHSPILVPHIEQFDKSLSSLTMWNLQSYPTTVLNERMWHLYVVKTHSDPSYIFSGTRDPQPKDLHSATNRRPSWQDNRHPARKGGQCRRHYIILVTAALTKYLNPPPRRLCFHRCLSVCRFVCRRDYSETILLIKSSWNFMACYWLDIISGTVD